MTVFDNILRILMGFAYIIFILDTLNGSYTLFNRKVDSKKTTFLFKAVTRLVYILVVLLMVGKFLTV